MPSEAAEAVWTRWEDRPRGAFSHRSRRVSRAVMTDPEELGRFLLRGHLNAVVVLAGDPVRGKTSLLTTMSDWFPVRQQIGLDMLEAAQAMLESFRLEDTRARTFRPELPPSDREVQLYKDELKKLYSKQSDEDRRSRERGKAASAYLDEAIALAHPIALRLLGWLLVSGSVDLERVFEIFGASASTFEGVARLHLIGAVKFEDGRLTITSLGSSVLEELGIVGAEEAKAT